MTAMPLTQTEFIDLPVAEHGRPWSLVDGEVVMTQPTPLHQRVQTRLIVAISVWAGAAPGRGEAILPLDVRIDELNVYASDVLWYAEGRTPGGGDVRPSPMPDIAAEVRSPSTWRYDIGAKKSGYERKGLPELWLVDTAAGEVLVFRRSTAAMPSFDVALQLTAGDVLGSPQLPGFALLLDELFGE